MMVVRNRTNIRAHMLRVHELLEGMSKEAMKNGAGPAVQDQWEVMLTEIALTKRRFEHVMSLYRIPDAGHRNYAKILEANSPVKTPNRREES